MFFSKSRLSRDDFEREVLNEVAYLNSLYGANAHAKAIERANRPHLRSPRRLVITEAARRLAAKTGR